MNMLFWLGSFLPYIRVIPIDTDTQPTVLLLSAMFFMYYVYCYGLDKLTKLETITAVGTGYALILSLTIFSFDLREILGYISIFLIVFSMNRVIKIDKIVGLLLEITIYIYLFTGIIQLIFRNFGHELILRMSTTLDRGVTSLTPEPSYYGIICFFMFCLVRIFAQMEVFSLEKSLLLQSVLFFQCIILARSFWGLIAFSLFYLFSTILNISFKRAVLVFTVVGILLIIISNLELSTRMGVLVGKLLSNPALLLLDASVNSRFYNILIPVNALFDGITGVIGHGTNAWPQYFAVALADYKNYFWVESSTKIMSGFGSMIFDCGLVGLFYPLLLCFGHDNYKNKEILTQSIVIYVLMFGAIPLTYPLFSIWVGLVFKFAGQAVNENYFDK